MSNEKVNDENNEKNNKVVKDGSTVSINYVGTFDDGQVFDKVDDKNKPFKFKVGSGQVIKKFEQELVGMKVGEKKKIHIKSDEAYGARNDALVLVLPKHTLEGMVDLKPGTRLMFTAPDGSVAYAEIKEVKSDSVVLDLNHPLAGKDLNFEIEVLDVED